MTDMFLHGHVEFQRRWLAEKSFLQRLATEGQTPRALYVGCADSRVVPEILTNAAPGDLFVVRNIANFVPPRAHADASVGASIEYALGPLDVQHIIVCGHTGCGGVKAAVAGAQALPGEMQELREWITSIETGLAPLRVHRLTPETLARRAEQENVLVSLGNLLSFEAVRAKLDRGALQLHGWLYDMHSLELKVYDGERNAFVVATELVH